VPDEVETVVTAEPEFKMFLKFPEDDESRLDEFVV
jgi:hypothetical protein